MAGKTFPGIGDLEDEVPPLDPADAADSLPAYTEAYSGPTVVDDAKVEQGLKKLRSLDASPGPNTGIHRAVTDALTDAPRATPQVPITVMPPTPATPRPAVTMFGLEPARDTTLGRSVVEPMGSILAQQATPPFDDKHLRGTLFGHDSHLPDLDIEAVRKEIETSKALAVVQRGQPTTNEIAIFQPGPYARPAGPPLGAQTPYPRFQTTPIEVRTEPVRRKVLTRVGLAALAIGLVVGAAVLWLRSNGDEGDAGARSGSGLLAPAPRLMEPPPAAPAPATQTPPAAATAPTAAAPAAPEVAPPTPAPAATAPGKRPLTADDVVVPPQPQPAAPPSAAPAHHSHPAPRADRHRAAPAAPKSADTGAKPARAEKPDDSEAPPPPKSARGKRGVEEDPDATMAPTIE